MWSNDKIVIPCLLTGYGIVRSVSQLYHIRPTASCDTTDSGYYKPVSRKQTWDHWYYRVNHVNYSSHRTGTVNTMYDLPRDMGVTMNLKQCINKQRVHHTAVCIKHLMLDNAAHSTLCYQLNARKWVDGDEPWVALCSYTLAVIFRGQKVFDEKNHKIRVIIIFCLCSQWVPIIQWRAMLNDVN